MGYRLLLCSLAFAVFLAITAVAMLGPLLVDMADALTVSVPVAAQLVTIAAAAWAATALMVGPFSDTYGRKPILLLGTCCVAAGSLGLGLTPSFAVAMAAGWRGLRKRIPYGICRKLQSRGTCAETFFQAAGRQIRIEARTGSGSPWSICRSAWLGRELFDGAAGSRIDTTYSRYLA